MMMTMSDRAAEIKTKYGRGSITKDEYDEYVALVGRPIDWHPVRHHGNPSGPLNTAGGNNVNQVPAKPRGTE